MRSSDTSGAVASGFGDGQDEPHAYAHPLSQLRERISALRLAITPAGAAVIWTAFAAATLFTIHDTTMAMSRAPAPSMMLVPVASADLDASSVPQPTSATMMSRPAFTAGADTRLQQPAPAIIDEVGPRALGAYGLAGIVALACIRRRRIVEDGDGTDRSGIEPLVSALPFGVACWTAEGTLLSANRAYAEAVGCAPSDRLDYGSAVKRLVQGGYIKLLKDTENNRSLELHRPDGKCLLIDERPIGRGDFLTLVSDVTERKQTDALLDSVREDQRRLARRYHEEKLKAEAASRSKTNFLAHLSHDVRTPLNHIIGFAELIRHQTFGPVGDARYLEYVQTIKNAGEHLLVSFATILDLAELEGGQKALRAERVEIDTLLEGCRDKFGQQAERAGVRLSIEARCGTVMSGDRFCLSRMLGNVVENSLRFTPRGGTITLSAYAARDGVVLEISDTGLGMSEERLESLTQPFALGDATFTRDGVGPGLGVPIARAIAELSGGHMAIDSSPSIGTTVAFTLPLRPPAELDARQAA